jgi:hypothetical protein
MDRVKTKNNLLKCESQGSEVMWQEKTVCIKMSQDASAPLLDHASLAAQFFQNAKLFRCSKNKNETLKKPEVSNALPQFGLTKVSG